MKIRAQTIYEAMKPIVTPFDDGSVALHDHDLNGGYRVDFRPKHLGTLRELIRELEEISAAAQEVKSAP